MPTSTFTPGDEKQDEKLNPGQQYADQTFNDLSGAEKRGTLDMSDFERNYGEDADPAQEDAAIDRVKNRESEGNPTSSWRTNVNSKLKVSGRQKTLAFFKKRGGILGILAFFGVGGGVLAGILGPLSMPINLMENMSLSNDSSSTALERRIMKSLGFMTKTSDPICANSSKLIKCRMGSISNKALAQLEKKGVVAYFDSDTTNSGKKTGYPSKNPAGYTIDTGDGKTVNVAAKDLRGFLAENPKAASKILGARGAFNLRVKAWSGKYIAKKLYAPFALEKRGGIADGKNGEVAAKERYNEALTKTREKIPSLEKLNGVAGGVKEKISGHLDKSKKGGVAYTLAVAGCIGVKAPGYIAAGVAAVQLAQLLQVANNVILSPGSKIKASGVDLTNSVTSSDVEAVGTLLTTQTERPGDGKMTSALDSKYLQSAIGINKNKPAVSGDFTPGYAILTSPVIVAANQAEKSSASTCNAIMSPAAMYTALAVDSAATIVASATIIGGVIKIAGSLVITTIATELVTKIAGEVATNAIAEFGQNDKIAGAEGEQLGDVLGISGAAFFSSGGMSRNLPTLTTSQLSDFAMMQSENESFQRDMDIASLSPFDASSRYTFLGSIVYNMNMTAVANGTYGKGFFSTLSNLAQLPFSGMSQNIGAATNFSENYCGYAEEFGLNTEDPANTPAINMAGMPCTGITTEQANMSTDEAISLLESEGWIDPSLEVPDGATIDELLGTVIKSDTPLSDFIETCGNPTTGDYLFNSAGCTVASTNKSTAGLSTSELDANGCFTNEAGEQVCASSDDFGSTNTEGVKNARSLQAMSVFLLDFQAIQSMNGEDEETASQASAPAATGAPAETISRGKGWTLADGGNYSTATCAAGTTDAGLYTHPKAGFTFRKCAFKNVSVNALVSENVVAMIEAAKNDGVTLEFNNSFRSYEEQAVLRAQNCNGNTCNPPTAAPGNSQHERGLAIDFANCSASSKCFQWLKSNAVTYGYYNLPEESWHWSVSGN